MGNRQCLVESNATERGGRHCPFSFRLVWFVFKNVSLINNNLNQTSRLSSLLFISAEHYVLVSVFMYECV